MARRFQPTVPARKQRHIDRGERAFLPASRMRAIRWEESIARARARRDGVGDHKVIHVVFHCGIECMGVPLVVPLGPKPRKPR